MCLDNDENVFLVICVCLDNDAMFSMCICLDNDDNVFRVFRQR